MLEKGSTFTTLNITANIDKRMTIFFGAETKYWGTLRREGEVETTPVIIKDVSEHAGSSVDWDPYIVSNYYTETPSQYYLALILELAKRGLRGPGWGLALDENHIAIPILTDENSILMDKARGNNFVNRATPVTNLDLKFSKLPKERIAWHCHKLAISATNAGIILPYDDAGSFLIAERKFFGGINLEPIILDLSGLRTIEGSPDTVSLWITNQNRADVLRAILYGTQKEIRNTIDFQMHQLRK